MEGERRVPEHEKERKTMIMQYQARIQGGGLWGLKPPP